MSDNVLDQIPCDSNPPIPDIHITPKNYEECDACSHDSEEAEGDVLDPDALKKELEALISAGEADDAKFLSDVDACVKAIAQVAADFAAAGQANAKTKETVGMVTELRDNLRPIYDYHRLRVAYFAQKSAGQLQSIPSASDVATALNLLPDAARAYEEPIEITTTYSPDPFYQPSARNITAVILKYRSYDKLNGSSEFHTKQILDSSAVQYSKVSADTKFELTSPSNSLYVEYYNKMSDPMNNFFAPEERGLTSDPSQIDPGYAVAADKLNSSGSGAPPMQASDLAVQKQGSLTFYVKDSAKFATFYSGVTTNPVTGASGKTEDDFEGRLSARVTQVFASLIEPKYQECLALIDKIAMYEASIDTDVSESAAFVSLYESMQAELTAWAASDAEYKAKMSIDPNNPNDSEMIKAMKASAPCVAEFLAQSPMSPSAQLNADQMKLKPSATFKIGPGGMGADSPNSTKACYWLQFCKFATIYGLLPFPDIEPSPTSTGPGMRYWPVGMVIPTPVTLIKIPLPIVWIPIIVITSKFGTIVLFIGICGVTPCPFVMYISPTGVKNFAVAMRMPPPGVDYSFGFDPSDALGYPLKIRVPFLSTLLDMDPFSVNLLGQVHGLEDFEKFKSDIKKPIDDTIDKMNVPESKAIEELKLKIKQFKVPSMQEKVDAIKKDVNDWIDEIKLPIYTIPKDNAKTMQLPAYAAMVEWAMEFLSHRFALPTFKLFNLKTKIMAKINDMLEDPDLNEWLSEIPSEVNLDVAEHYKKFQDFMKKVAIKLHKLFDPEAWDPQKSYGIGSRVRIGADKYASVVSGNAGDQPNPLSETWISVDDLMKSLMMLPAISISNPLQCKDALMIPPIDLSLLAVLSAAFQAIIAMIDSLAAGDVIAAIGFSTFTAKEILVMITEIFSQLIPDIPLPPPEFVQDYAKAFKQSVKDFLKISPPPVPLLSPMQPPAIVIDLNLIKPPIKAIIDASIQLIIDALPFDILKNGGSLGFESLSAADIKIIVKDIIDSEIDALLEPFRVPYDAASLATGLYRLVKKQQSPLDVTMSPQRAIIEKAKAQVKAVVDKFKSSLDDQWVASPEAVQLALEILDALPPIPFPAVGAACAFGGAKIIRAAHPILYEDDLPPWERLTLDNFLFVVFLDEFCHKAKWQGGIFESYLP